MGVSPAGFKGCSLAFLSFPKRCGENALGLLSTSKRSSIREAERQRKRRKAGQFQEHDSARNLLAHNTEDQQAKELIHARLCLPLVQTKGRAGIGTRRIQAPLPRNELGEDDRLEQRSDRCSSLDPGRDRWHGKPSVLS